MSTLLQGDCLDLMGDIPDGSIDMVMCDPPYGTTACRWDSIIPLEPMWEHLKRIIKPNGAILMTASQPFTTTLIGSNMGMFKYCWYWEKNISTSSFNVSKQPLRCIEDLCIFYSNQVTYNPQGIRKLNKTKSRKSLTDNYGRIKLGFYNTTQTGFPRQLLQFDGEVGREHPTQKPVPLMEYLIRTYTQPGETVLDFTMGSGTTGVACANLDREFIGIELDPDYFKIAERRIKQAEDQLKLFPLEA